MTWHYSRGWLLVPLLGGLWFTLSGAYGALGLIHVLGPLTALMGLAPVVLGLAFMVFAIRAMRREAAVLVIDRHGIADLRGQGRTIPWDDVAAVSIGGRGRRLQVRFHSGEIARRYLGSVGAGLGAIWRVVNGGHTSINLAFLQGTRGALLRHAQAHLAAHMASRGAASGVRRATSSDAPVRRAS